MIKSNQWFYKSLDAEKHKLLKLMESPNSIKLLGINKDNKLIVEDHASEFCNKASKQLNAISRLKSFFRKKLEVISHSFIYQVSMIVLLTGMSRMIHKGCDNDYGSILEMGGKRTMEIKRIKKLAIEMSKTVTNLNPSFRQDARVWSYSLMERNHKAATYNRKGL